MPSSELARKLRIKDGYRVAVVNAPPPCLQMLEPLPERVAVTDTLQGAFDLIWYFATSKVDLERDFPKLRQSVMPAGLLWVSYPKGTSGVKTDLNRDILRAAGQEAGLQAVALIAVDDVWSALRLKVV